MLTSLHLTDFRSYQRAGWNFDAPVTVFTGPNGAGKSNLLEAIFFLGLLRSFRTNRLRETIRAGARSSIVEAAITGRRWSEDYRVEYFADGKRKLSIGGIPVARSSEFIRGIQPVVFAPEDRRLITGSAAERRRFFDMLIALGEPDYWSSLANYYSALLRRNAALKAREEAVARAFEPEMAACAVRVAARRRLWAERLAQGVSRRLPEEEFTLDYQCDYPEDEAGCRDYFDRCRGRELKAGFTLFGPQLDEFRIGFKGLAARAYASTGQGRKLAIMVKLAAAELMRQHAPEGDQPLLALVDDVTGDLDAANREHFLEELKLVDQLFFTFTGPPGEPFFRDARIISLVP